MKRKLKFIFMLLFLSIFIFIQQDTTYAETVNLEGGELVNNRTLVPLRSIFEELGASVSWNQETKTVTAAKDNKEVWLQIGSKITEVDGKVVTIDVPAQVKNGRTLVPLRFVSEAMGASVRWDGNNNIATIIQGKKMINVALGNKVEKEENILKEPLEVVDKNLMDYNGNMYSTGISLNIIGTPELTLLIWNTTKKDIDAFEFEAHLYDTFDRPVNKVGTDSNLFKGIAQNILIRADAETFGAEYPWDAITWNLVLYDLATEVKDIKITSVHFTDGTIWKAK